MSFERQKILPAVRGMKDFEQLIESKFNYIVLLDSHVGKLRSIVNFAKSRNKKILLHADLVHGLKSDEYAAEFLCQEIKPAGLISTRNNIIQTAKKQGVLAIQRLFLLDSIALETSFKQIDRSKPDYIEVLPGVIPDMIREVKNETGIPIFAGGLIRTVQEAETAVAAGAEAVTTSRKDLWKTF